MRMVNFQAPIRRNAPLNKGLLRWWRAEPFRNHSPRLQELSRKSPVAITGGLRLGPRGLAGSAGVGVFDGSDDYGKTAATVDLTGTTTLSVSFWLYWNSFISNDDLCLESSADYNSNTDGIAFNPNSSSGSNFFIGIKTSGGYNVSQFTRPSAAVWHHYVTNFDRNAGAQQVTHVYVDGVAQSLSNTFTNSASGAFGNFVWNFMSRNGASAFGLGRIDDIRIYNRLLPAWEARALYNASRRGYPQELRWSRWNDFIGEAAEVPDPYIPYSVPYHRRSFKAMAPIKNAGHAMGTLSSAVPLTTIPGNALRARVVGVSGSATVYFREDSGTPSASNGTPIGAGGYADIVGRNNLEGFRAIEASPSGTLWVEYFDSVE